MTCGDDGFHFVDLLGLHVGCRMPIPEADGLLELMHTLTDIHLPALGMYPPNVVAAACNEVRQQFPWLPRIPRSPSAQENDWAYIWAWVDKYQQRHGVEPDGTPTVFRVQPIPAERMPRMPTIVILRPEDEG